MSKTYPLNTVNPPGNSDRRLGDNYIRQLALAVAELIGKEHYLGSNNSAMDDIDSGYDSDDAGEHAKVTLRSLQSEPTEAEDKGILYTTGASVTELYYLDSDGNGVQISSLGKVCVHGLIAALSDLILCRNTSDGSDNGSVSIAGGGYSGTTTATSRGAIISACGNENALTPGQVVLNPGYYSGGTVRSWVDVKSALIKNVADPAADQDAATKKYVDDGFDRSIAETDYVASVVHGATYTDYKDVGLSIALTGLKEGQKLFIRFDGLAYFNNHSAYFMTIQIMNGASELANTTTPVLGWAALINTLILNYVHTCAADDEANGMTLTVNFKLSAAADSALYNSYLTVTKFPIG